MGHNRVSSQPSLGSPSRQGTHILDMDTNSSSTGAVKPVPEPGTARSVSVTLLTGGGDRPYAFGLATELISKGVSLDLIGSDDLDCPEFHRSGVNFLNLRGDQRTEVGFLRKVSRILVYYARLICYAATAKPRIFHILWNNKFELFDRTLLMLYYKALGKKIVLTLHNVNRSKRDSKDSLLNRTTLRIQYRLSEYIFVHTEKMKADLIEEFDVRADHVGVIPFGINNAVPNTELSAAEARRRLGIRDDEKTILFFGNIAPYKGLEYLTVAFQHFLAERHDFRLIIGGWPKNCESYWSSIREAIEEDIKKGRILLKAEYICDEDTELYFKAADVLVLPYRYIYQSGVLFLGYSFGLPVLAADVGSLKEEIIEGKTGFVFRAEDAADLANAIERYFASDLFANLSGRRQEIQNFARERHSWSVVGETTMNAYTSLLQLPSRGEVPKPGTSNASLDVKASSRS
jgi:D-inositol-3-phosphate glycosyltransferase